MTQYANTPHCQHTGRRYHLSMGDVCMGCGRLLHADRSACTGVFGRADMAFATSARILGEALEDHPPAQPPLSKYGPPIHHIDLDDTDDT